MRLSSTTSTRASRRGRISPSISGAGRGDSPISSGNVLILEGCCSGDIVMGRTPGQSASSGALWASAGDMRGESSADGNEDVLIGRLIGFRAEDGVADVDWPWVKHLMMLRANLCGPQGRRMIFTEEARGIHSDFAPV